MLSRLALALLVLAPVACQRLPEVALPDVALPGTGSAGTKALVENRVWIDTDPSAVRGTLRTFVSDGTLIMTSCGETYRLAAWRWLNDTTLVWEEDGQSLRAEVAMVERKSLVLVLDVGGTPQTLSYRAAQAPEVCPDLPR